MAGELILIIEDNEKNRKLFRDVLRHYAFETVETETAEEGLRVARELRPALVLMDISLPGMSGIDALRALRAEPSTSGIPVMAVTASVMIEDEHQIRAEGFDAYQRKPIDIKALVAEVHSML